MKYIKKIILIFILLSLFIPNIKAEKNITLYLFYGDGCPHCAAEEEYLEQVKKQYPNLQIELYEVWYDEDNQTLLQNVRESFGISNSYVPLTIVGNKTLVGYSDETGSSKIDKILEQAYNDSNYEDYVSQIIEKKESITITNEVDDDPNLTIPILGEINVVDFSLPIITIAIGLVDGFNPCALWILLFLISMLINTKDKKRLFVLGMTFILTSGLIYMFIMLSWLTITVKISSIIWIRNIIALIAIIGGILNLRTYIKTKETGCSVVDAKKRKSIMEKIKKFTIEKSFFIAILGMIALAISVNVIEFACSAGLPLLFTQILAINELSNIQYFMYILLYVFCFLFDEIVIFLIALFSFKITGISNKYTKYSHLIGGIIMLLIGLLLILKPEWIMLNF